MTNQAELAEGDGWIAAPVAVPSDDRVVRVKATALKREYWQPKMPDGEYDGFYDHEDGKWFCYTGVHDSSHLYDCTVREWRALPVPPVNEETK